MNQEYIEWEEEPIIQPTSDLKRLGCCSSQDLADGREEADDEEALAQLEVDWRSHRGTHQRVQGGRGAVVRDAPTHRRDGGTDHLLPQLRECVCVLSLTCLV